MTAPQRIERITSLANARLKAVAALAKARERIATASFTIEGAREIGQALEAKVDLVAAWFCPELASDASRSLWARAQTMAAVELYEVGRDAYGKIAMREDKDGLVVVARPRVRTLGDVRLGRQPLVLAVSGVEKPGNLGALLRSADGAGVDAVVVLGGGCDLYNPHCIRASLGTLFSQTVVEATSADFLAWCRQHDIATFAAALVPGAQAPDTVDMRRGAALVLGSEAFGLAQEMIDACDHSVVIPMRGVVDSLNVSVAGAILLYEARRQQAGMTE